MPVKLGASGSDSPYIISLRIGKVGTPPIGKSHDNEAVLLPGQVLIAEELVAREAKGMQASDSSTSFGIAR